MRITRSRWLIRLLMMLIICMSVQTAFAVKPLGALPRDTQDPYEIAVAAQHHESDRATQRLKTFFMARNRKLWGRIAEYQAESAVKASKAHKVELSLLAGVISAESEGNPFSVSRTGAKGSAQVDFNAHGSRFPQIKEERDKFDPEKNIDCAAELLKEYTTQYGLRNGLQVYNLGETAYRKGRRNPRYADKVLRYARLYRHF